MSKALTREELEAHHCWEAEDRVAGRPQMTEFRRRARYHQARWREAHGHPEGTQPIAPRLGARRVRPLGSRLPLVYAQETGANFLTSAALAAVRARTSTPEPRQTFDHQRVWADLLWSPAFAFNLFGELAGDLALADRAVHTWWPDVPGRVCDVRFAHSPGRLDPAYLNSLRAFDAAFVLDLGDGTRGIVAVDVNYHERNKPETPRPENRSRYRQVAGRSEIFAPGAIAALERKSDLCLLWLEHLLLHAMLQHAAGEWRWGRYVVVRPSGNSDIADACSRYAGLLADGKTFVPTTLEELLDAKALPARSAAALRERYVFG